METLLSEEIKKGAFKLDFAKINQCKGTVKVFVKPFKKSDTLILNDIESEIYSSDMPYELSCSHPIVNGVLEFKPVGASPQKMKSVVRLVLIK